MKKVILSLAVLSTLFVSCEDDKNEDIIPPIVVEVPDTYTFTRGGLSTVSYGPLCTPPCTPTHTHTHTHMWVCDPRGLHF